MGTRTEYVERLSAQMVEWDNEIERLKDKAKSAPPGEAPDTDAITALKGKRDEAALKLEKISTADADQWEELKTGTDQVVSELRTILHDAILKVK